LDRGAVLPGPERRSQCVEDGRRAPVVPRRPISRCPCNVRPAPRLAERLRQLEVPIGRMVGHMQGLDEGQRPIALHSPGHVLAG
jgi:hypothetical protein